MLHNSIAILSAIILPLVAADCYSSGVKGNEQFALDNIASVAVQMQGGLAGHQGRAHCLTDANAGYHWYFAIKNKGGNPQTVQKEDIERYLMMEINGCSERGGSSKHGKIQYT